MAPPPVSASPAPGADPSSGADSSSSLLRPNHAAISAIKWNDTGSLIAAGQTHPRRRNTVQPPATTAVVSEVIASPLALLVSVCFCTGLSSGALHIYSVSSELHTPTREATDRFYNNIANRMAHPR